MADQRETQRPRVGIVGVNGHGRWHLDNVRRLADAGDVTLAAVCDRSVLDDEVRAVCAAHGAETFDSYDAMLAAAALDVVVIATPPHVHRAMACAALEAGADVLLEKPPTVRLADLAAVVETAQDTGRLCQVGFQSLGSAGFDAAREALTSGLLGSVSLISAAGAWIRRPSYFSRGPWTGRRMVGDVAVGDGAISNPFAHALMNCVTLADADCPARVVSIEAELCRANEIESDDTSALRVVLDNGRTIAMAVTLCADVLVEPYLTLHGTDADLRWGYTVDTVELQPHGGAARELPLGERTDLLEDLLAVRSAGGRLRCPADACRDYTALTETLLDTVGVRAIPAEYAVRDDADPDAAVIVPGISDLVQAAASRGLLFSELGVPWAVDGR